MTGNVVVIGMGDNYRRDDGVGPGVVRRLRRRHLPGLTLAESDGTAEHLIELWDEALLAVVVDSVHRRPGSPGRVHRMSLRHPALGGGRGPHSHAIELGWAVTLATDSGQLPRTLLLYGIEVADTGYGLGLTPQVAQAADALAAALVGELRGELRDCWVS